MSENTINLNNNEIKLIIREMQDKDYEEVLEMGTDLGSVIHIYANQVMMKVDGKGMFVAQDLNTGKLLGMCTGVNHSPEYAHIGQFGVRKEYQKLGIGKRLLAKAMEHMGKDRNIGLFAREGAFEYYRDKHHFIHSPNRIKILFMGKVNDLSQLVEAIDGISVVPISDDNIERVIQYDKEVCDGLDRSVLIQELIKIDEYVIRVAIDLKGVVLGFICVNMTNLNLANVEPLYANDEKIAELLLRNCLKPMPSIQTKGLIYCCWNTNTKSMAIVAKLGLTNAIEVPIMFTKRVVSGDMDRVFCGCSPTFYPL